MKEEEEGKEKVARVLHDINDHMACSLVPVGLCVMSLSCRCVTSAVPELKGPGKCFCNTYKSVICREGRRRRPCGILKATLDFSSRSLVQIHRSPQLSEIQFSHVDHQSTGEHQALLTT